MGTALLDVTGLDKSAHERINGLRDGEISFSAFFNDAALQEHVALKGLLKTDRYCLYCRGTTLGNQAAALLGKQINYDFARGADLSLLATIQVLGTGGYGLEWGLQHTAGKRTDTGAMNGSGVNHGTQGSAVTITNSSAANPTVITTPAPHGFVTNDRIVIAGHSGSTPDINSVYTVTKLTDNTFTVPVNVTVGGTGGTVTKTSTSFGLAAYLQAFSFAGTDVTVKLQGSNDDGATDAYADITGGGFTQITTAPTEERIETSLTLVVERWIRVATATTGGFTSLVFAVVVVRYTASARG